MGSLEDETIRRGSLLISAWHDLFLAERRIEQLEHLEKDLLQISARQQEKDLGRNAAAASEPTSGRPYFTARPEGDAAVGSEIQPTRAGTDLVSVEQEKDHEEEEVGKEVLSTEAAGVTTDSRRLPLDYQELKQWT